LLCTRRLTRPPRHHLVHFRGGLRGPAATNPSTASAATETSNARAAYSAMSFFYFNADGFQYLLRAARETYDVLCDLQPLSTLGGYLHTAASSVGASLELVARFLVEAPSRMRRRILGDMCADARAAGGRITSTRATAITREPTVPDDDAAHIDAAEMGQAEAKA